METSFDIKTTFLRGKADEKNPLAMEPLQELRKLLGLSPDEVCTLLGNAYGRLDAPLLFYGELSKQLLSLGFWHHPLDSCIFLLETYEQGQRRLRGVLGTHVDDGFCGGDALFEEKIQQLKSQLPFGSEKQTSFLFPGIYLEELPDFSIRASQREYVNHIPPIDIPRARRTDPSSPLTSSETSSLRGLVGSLQCAVTHTRPDIAACLAEVQGQIARGTVQTLLEANRTLKEAQEHSQVSVTFKSLSPRDITFVSFGDAAFASKRDLRSQQGTIIAATTTDLSNNVQAPLSPLVWTCKKISRVVRSTISAAA